MSAADLSTLILVADNQAEEIRHLTHGLVRMGFTNIRPASDGSTGLAQLKCQSFGLVITDLDMEPMSGSQMIEDFAAAEAPNTPQDIPFIVMTSQDEERLKAAFQGKVLTKVLSKPVGFEALRQAIEACLGPLPQESL